MDVVLLVGLTAVTIGSGTLAGIGAGFLALHL